VASTFERDEFDDLAEQAGPVGVHRAHRNVLARLLVALVVTFVLAGGAAYGLATYYWESGGGTPDPTETPSPTPDPTPTIDPSPSPSPSPSLSPSPEPEPEPVINFGVGVTVLNASGIGGLAGKQQEELEDAGFTNVAAGNLTFSLPEENTVIYAAAGQADTAAFIAEVLGIDNVEQGSPPGGNAIEVILRTDPDA
jgi:hypothetical protein